MQSEILMYSCLQVLQNALCVIMTRVSISKPHPVISYKRQASSEDVVRPLQSRVHGGVSTTFSHEQEGDSFIHSYVFKLECFQRIIVMTPKRIGDPGEDVRHALCRVEDWDLCMDGDTQFAQLHQTSRCVDE